MRMLMRVQMDTEVSNRAIENGSAAKTIEQALEQLHAEAAYFTTSNGERTAYIVFDLQEPAQMPQMAEPFFMEMGAKVDMSPVMKAEDLQEGLARLQHR